jgi:hypothetical protein
VAVQHIAGAEVLRYATAMNLKFRINSMVQHDEPEWGPIDTRPRYDAFVEARKGDMPKPLWTYFGIDSFHDGQIKRLTFDAACRDLELHLTCPNVKFFPSPESNEFEFLNVDFVARFIDVYKFVLVRQQQEEGFQAPGCPTFLYGEVETAEEDIREANERAGEEHHSLMIEADVFRAGIIFQYVHVTAAEPTATAWMMHDSRYKFPFLQD